MWTSKLYATKESGHNQGEWEYYKSRSRQFNLTINPISNSISNSKANFGFFMLSKSSSWPWKWGSLFEISHGSVKETTIAIKNPKTPTSNVFVLLHLLKVKTELVNAVDCQELKHSRLNKTCMCFIFPPFNGQGVYVSAFLRPFCWAVMRDLIFKDLLGFGILQRHILNNGLFSLEEGKPWRLFGLLSAHSILRST